MLKSNIILFLNFIKDCTKISKNCIKNLKDKKSSTKASQLAYKVDKIASGLHLTLNFEDEKTVKISENFRELYRHVRFAMKMIYEKQEYKFLNSARDVAKTLYESWAKIKPTI